MAMLGQSLLVSHNLEIFLDRFAGQGLRGDITPRRHYPSNSLKISNNDLKFSEMMQSTMKQIAI